MLHPLKRSKASHENHLTTEAAHSYHNLFSSGQILQWEWQKSRQSLDQNDGPQQEYDLYNVTSLCDLPKEPGKLLALTTPTGDAVS